MYINDIKEMVSWYAFTFIYEYAAFFLAHESFYESDVSCCIVRCAEEENYELQIIKRGCLLLNANRHPKMHREKRAIVSDE